MSQDLAQKRQLITKFGAPVTVYGKLTGVVLSAIGDDVFRVSVGDGSVNWTDDIPLDQIEVGGFIPKVSTKGEFLEKESEGCEGGGCTI